MSDNKKKVSNAGKKGKHGGQFTAIGSVSVTCVPGTPMPGPMPMPTKNVTVTATGVTAPFGFPHTSILGSIMATLKRNGAPVGPAVPMDQDLTVPGKYSTTFFFQSPGTFDATVVVTWKVDYKQSETNAVPCACP